MPWVPIQLPWLGSPSSPSSSPKQCSKCSNSFLRYTSGSMKVKIIINIVIISHHSSFTIHKSSFINHDSPFIVVILIPTIPCHVLFCQVPVSDQRRLAQRLDHRQLPNSCSTHGGVPARGWWGRAGRPVVDRRYRRVSWLQVMVSTRISLIVLMEIDTYWYPNIGNAKLDFWRCNFGMYDVHDIF